MVIIDDDEGMCLMVKETLEAGGEFTVTTTSDPTPAENLIRQSTPDVILLDIVMPKRKGTEIITALKKDDALKGIPIIVVSGKGEVVNDVLAKAAKKKAAQEEPSPEV